MVRDKVTHMFFGADVAYDATGMSSVDAGEIIVIDKGGSILDAAAIAALGSNDPFYIVEGKRGNNVSHIISPKLTKGGIVGHYGSSYAAAVQQVTYIGDNSNAGTINILNSTEYSISVSFEWDKDVYSHRRDAKTYHYTSDAAATATEIANGFVVQMNADKGFSKQAIAAVETGGGAVGIKITGIAQPESDFDNPSIVSFSVALNKGFTAATQIDERGYIYVNGATPVASAYSKAPSIGVGTASIIKAKERNNDGFQNGVTANRKFPVVKPDSRVSATGTYDVYVIDYKDEHANGEIGIGSTRTTQGQIIVANDISTSSPGASTAALEALFVKITGVTVGL